MSRPEPRQDFDLRLSYWDGGCGAFDPERVVNLVRQAFPDCVCPEIDHSEAAHERIKAFVGTSDSPEETKHTMLQQSLRKHRRNGPCYRFEIPLGSADRVLLGTANRYSVRISAKFDLTEAEQQTIRTFLQSLTLGEPRLSES